MQKQLTTDSELEKSGTSFRISVVFAALVALIALSVFLLDRPLATFLRAHLTGYPVFVWLTYLVTPSAPLACVSAVFIGARTFARGSLTDRESALLRLSCAILVAGVLTHELKDVFGRTWPETWINNNPSYFGNGTYGFFPFHGGRGYAAFPSGHIIAAAAFAGAVWCLWPALKWLGITLTLAVAIGLLGANYHWLSVVIAGALLGPPRGSSRPASVAVRRSFCQRQLLEIEEVKNDKGGDEKREAHGKNNKYMQPAAALPRLNRAFLYGMRCFCFSSLGMIVGSEGLCVHQCGPPFSEVQRPRLRAVPLPRSCRSCLPLIGFSFFPDALLGKW